MNFSLIVLIMKESECVISPTRKKRLEQQGYTGFSDTELYDHKFGFRFAYYMCGSIVIIGLLLNNITILGLALVIAFFGMFPPRHPVDYLYNSLIRHLINKPKLPHRAPQGRFACGMATIMLGIIVYLFYAGFSLWGYIVGAALVSSAFLVSVLDICIPSMIYNSIFGKTQG
jgi:hypothetical protein